MNKIRIIIPLIIIMLTFNKSNYEILNVNSEFDHYDRFSYEFFN